MRTNYFGGGLILRWMGVIFALGGISFSRCNAADLKGEVAIRVVTPGGKPIAIDDIDSIVLILDDGGEWRMGPDPVVRRRSAEGWVDVDASLFTLNKPGQRAIVTIQSGGMAMRGIAKIPRKGWKRLEYTAEGEPNEIGVDISAGPSTVGEGEIAGIVVDPKGNPVAGAVVSFPRPEAFGRLPGAQPVTTRDDGVFRFPKSEHRGGLYMQVEKAGYASRWITDVPEGKGFTIHLDNKTHLAGKLTVPDGTAAVDAKIELAVTKASARFGKWSMGESIPYTGSADELGDYDLPLEPGEYDISVTSPAGFVARHEHVQVVSGTTTAMPAELMEGVKLTVMAINSITAKPLAGVHFYQEEMAPGFISQKAGSERVTDAQGMAKWDGLLPGPAGFDVRAAGFGRWWILEQDPSRQGGRGIDALGITLTVGMPTVTVEMEPAVRVTGQVLSPSGQPVKGAVVDIGRLRTGDSRYHKQTDAQGRFELSFPDLSNQPGHGTGAGYVVIAYDPKGRFANGLGEEFKPKAGDEKSFVIHMTAGARMHGTVVDANGKPEKRIEMLAVNRDLIDASYYYPCALTDDQGHFDLGPMRPGEYEVHATIEFGRGVPTRTVGDQTSIGMNDTPTVATVHEGDNSDLGTIKYDGPPPGAVPEWYERRFPAALK